MFAKLRHRFSAKLILLISLVFAIPVATALITLKMTSKASLERFDEVINGPATGRDSFIKEIFPQTPPEDLREPEKVLRLLKDYEHRRTFGLFMSLVVISVALAGVVVLLSMLILKRGMLSLHELSLAAAKVGNGDFKVTLHPYSKDEFADLVQAFGTMATRLDETMVSRDFYNHVLQSMPVAVFTVDNNGRITTWNTHAEKLSGLKASETIGKLLSDFSDVVGKPANPQDVPFFGREYVMRLRSGEQRIVSRGVDFLYDRGGSHAGIIETFVDISEQKELEQQLVIAKERAEESSRLRSEFLANMSHEIRTPLNGILGLAETMAEDEADAERKENLVTIEKCGRNLLYLINEILELSKLEAGKMLLHPAVSVLEDILKESIATVEIGCRRKGIDLSFHISPEVPSAIEVDRGKLVQVLVNLLGNSLKFTDKGYIRIGIKLYRGGHRGDLLFEVADSGAGIPDDRKQYIFESFVSAEGYLTRTGGGTGLGLTIANKLIKLMGGEIWFESEQRKGSNFYFTIGLTVPDLDRR